MKPLFFSFLIVLFTSFASAQQRYLDSLYLLSSNPKDDTAKVLAFSELANYYAFNQFDSAIVYVNRTIDLSKKIDFPYGTSLGLFNLFFAYNCQGNYSKALEVSLEYLKIVEKIRRKYPYAFAQFYYFLGILNREMGNLPTALIQLENYIALGKSSGIPVAQLFPAYSQLASIHLRLRRPDSALWYAQTGYDLSLKPNKFYRYRCLSSAVLGNIHASSGNNDLAKKYFYDGIQEGKMVNNSFLLARNYNTLADFFYKTGHKDSCLYYAKISLQLCREHNFGEWALEASTLLTHIYESQNRPDSTIKYIRTMLEAKDSMFSQKKVQEFEKTLFEDEQRKQATQKAQENYKNRIKTYALLSGIIVLLSLAFILFRNVRQKQKANLKIEKAYKDLKSTQTQLIQSEKMASLGELTAGIAHEIQNPLNFVNNFSEVNKELIAEMREEIAKGNYDQVNVMARNLEDNEEKINHHGKRADAIVKGMLQHSRKSSGIKEPTEINAFADEYLRLAYHGLRANDNLFNVAIKTDFDPGVQKINIIPQDIGRVLLNLYNNAFYTVTEKKKQKNEGYEPIVSISTKRTGDKVEIRVKDNGNGIPQKILDKIFQPFFTTKPTGEGTGLGLSLAYDIVKAHAGELKVESREGEGSEFTIDLPLK